MNICCQEYTDIDLALMDPVIKKHREMKGALIPVLQQVQAIYGWLPEPVVRKVSSALNIYISEIYGVISFYSQFYTTPQGKYLIKICRGTACHVKGSERIQDRILSELNIEAGEMTPDKLYSVEEVACVGACGIAPVVIIDTQTFGSLTVGQAVDAVKNFEPDVEED